MNIFSLELGLLDYVNVILATLFYILVCIKLKSTMKTWLYRTMIVGAVISIVMALFVPTIKVMVGLKLFEYETPRYILALTYLGFFLFGGSLFLSTFKKFKRNFSFYSFDIYLIGVLLGGIGRILIYISFVKMCLQKKKVLSLCFIVLSLLLMLIQIYEASGGPVPIAWFHWAIEITNITCQTLLLIGVWLYFKTVK